ncbi:MAG: M23 family metallopeptidase [Omnitrophica WOR_2 bacterium]
MTNPFDPPPAGKDSGHHGVDFAYYRRGERLSIEGVTIQSVLDGRVTAVVKNRPPYGNMTIIESPASVLPGGLKQLMDIQPTQSVYLLYAHMKETPVVSIGQKIACGSPLGEVGNTPAGWSSAPHLHFEVRIGPAGITFSGMAYYDNAASQEEMDNYRRWRMSSDFRMVNPMDLLDYGLKS